MVGKYKQGRGRLVPALVAHRRWLRGRAVPAPVYEAVPRLLLFALGLLLSFGGAVTCRAALQFDVFLGYDGIVPEASWFPVVCEVKNDGPTFVGTVELEGGAGNQGQLRRIVVELPTGTLKRFVLPVFSTTRNYSSWDVRLYDERGKMRGEQTGLRARKQTAANTPVIGSLPRTANGAPVVRAILPQQSELQPASARFQSSIFPDNPLVLEGLSTIYLNSEKASELKVTQVNALFAWINAGGHLIVAVEQVSEITSTPWLKSLFPCDLKELQAVRQHPELQEWLRTATTLTNASYAARQQAAQVNRRRAGNRPGAAPPAVREGIEANNPFSDLSDDYTFETAELQVATGTVREGRVVVAAGGTPLIVTANRGRGRVTGLLFSPEREPARSWKNLPTFWAKLTEVPSAWYVSADFNHQGGWSSDGIFGAMIDTKQVHKLPLEWLLLLLIAYLVVIGPLDQWWLKRIGRPMLTWITFPTYVVVFSLLIYFIGYKLRSGESEWNELHLVDVLSNGERAELRGRTYASVYSPSNQRYMLEGQQKFATLRGEFAGGWGGGQSSEKATVMQNGDSFKAEIFVPVWTSQLFVSDWWQTAPMPLIVSVTRQGEAWQVKVENKTDTALTNSQIVVDGYIMPVGELPAKQIKTYTVSKEEGVLLREFVAKMGQSFQSTINSRQRAFGAAESGRISDVPHSTIAASFLSQMANPNDYMNNFIGPPGLDLGSVVEHGDAVLFAWAADYSPVKAMHQFSPRRTHRDTMWRVATEVQSPESKF